MKLYFLQCKDWEYISPKINPEFKKLKEKWNKRISLWKLEGTLGVLVTVPEAVNRWSWGAANPFAFCRGGASCRALHFLPAATLNAIAISDTLIKYTHAPHTTPQTRSEKSAVSLSNAWAADAR